MSEGLSELTIMKLEEVKPPHVLVPLYSLRSQKEAVGQQLWERDLETGLRRDTHSRTSFGPSSQLRSVSQVPQGLS